MGFLHHEVDLALHVSIAVIGGAEDEDGPALTSTSLVKVLSKRCIVECSRVWRTPRRRLTRDCERTATASEAPMELAFHYTITAQLTA